MAICSGQIGTLAQTPFITNAKAKMSEIPVVIDVANLDENKDEDQKDSIKNKGKKRGLERALENVKGNPAESVIQSLIDVKNQTE